METERKFQFDLFVIGGGSGGITAASRAAKLGKKVGLADFVKKTPQGVSWGVGGTCVNVGCIPKKMMHYASLLGEARKDQEACGWKVPTEGNLDWDVMVANVNAHVKSLNWGYKSMFSESNITYFNALAKFLDPHTLELKDGKGQVTKATAEYIIVAVGGRPNYLDTPGAREHCITSDDLFWKQQSPGKTLIVGAGYIAMECGGFLRGMGLTVDVLYREKILKAFDQDMVERVVQNMKEMGVSFKKGVSKKFEKKGDKIAVELELEEEPPAPAEGENGTAPVDKPAEKSNKIGEAVAAEKPKLITLTEEYDTVLLAVSRHADTAGLGLEAAGVKKHQNGKIIVDEQWRTSAPNVFALGDVTTISKELTPLASKEGVYIVKGVFEGKWMRIDYDTIPTTVFTPLEYSTCGLMEAEAIKRFGEKFVDVYHSSFAPLEWYYLESRPKNQCYCKIVVHIPTRKVLGVHYVGPNAGEVMAGYSVVVRKGLTYEDINDTIGIHPTTGEELAVLELTKRENPLADKKGC